MLKKDPWIGYIKPGRIFGNLYFVGTHPSSIHLIDTGDGLMLIDTGYLDNLYLTVQGIWEMGFDPRDIKVILLSHCHFDHTNGASALQQLSGAKIYLGKDDAWLCDGKINHCTLPLRPFLPDVLLSDGDTVTLGNTTVTCVSTPGHTDGVMSFFFDVSDGTRTLRAGMHGGVGLNTLSAEFLTRNALPFENRDKYFASLERLKQEHVDIFIGNHVGNNDTEGKLARVHAGEADAFIDPTEWPRFLERCRERLLALIEQEKAESN